MTKKTLIILPGWGGNKETWKNFAELASKDFDVHIIELPCFGDEPCPKTVWDIEDYVEFVKNKLLERHSREGGNLKLVKDPRFHGDDAVLLGHSFGGQVATVFASKYPEMIEKLILTAPAVFRPKKTFRRVVFNIGAKFGKLIFKIPWIENGSLWAEKIYHQAIGAKDYHDSSGIKREIFKNIIRQDRGVEASKITIPTLIVWGTMDGYLPVADANQLNKLIKNSKLEIVNGGRHGLHLQIPEKLLYLIKSFLEKNI
ncbi:MAG: Carboxylesterase BioH [Candidatus Magasanikbacteria bacterium GW2011_GWC2_37_14]|uniref:Carboxylesterase BioH n=1 Tax=Candidatus Magasanikbacteria bacterium GW2011_GWC2_37_14 TaxID=1619046 RepID=A0A0G0GAJ0_9BACT|nr:MAG: Carboxylesterase BioH [Candidatus Magasanikbacteria bacterium GW2011_GWC2_37_14]